MSKHVTRCMGLSLAWAGYVAFLSVEGCCFLWLEKTMGFFYAMGGHLCEEKARVFRKKRSDL